MSHWNNEKRRKLFNPSSNEPFKISRTGIDLFLECPRCFYLDKRIGVKRPGMPGWPLNSAVDELLKKEFDILRKNGQSHALMQKYNLPLVPYKHPDIDIWRDNFKGKEYLHKETNLIVSGAIDDIWADKKGILHIVDYKATSTNKEISLEDEYKQGYKRQMEVYQWIFRMSDFRVSRIGYFVFANGLKNEEKFDGKLNFELSILTYTGDDSWVEPTVIKIKECLMSNEIPEPSQTCEYCSYRKEVDIVL